MKWGGGKEFPAAEKYCFLKACLPSRPFFLLCLPVPLSVLFSTGGPGNLARLNAPAGIAATSQHVFISDSINDRIRLYDRVSGNVTLFAGGGPDPPGLKCKSVL